MHDLRHFYASALIRGGLNVNFQKLTVGGSYARAEFGSFGPTCSKVICPDASFAAV